MPGIATKPIDAVPARFACMVPPRGCPSSSVIGPNRELPLAPGEGRIVFARVAGATALVSCAAASPLQILSPRRRGESAWAVLSSHGGGLVSGDQIGLSIEVGSGATGLVATQAEGKVFRSAVPSRLLVEGRVRAGGLLALLPDPVSCYSGARYSQEQRFILEPEASLLFVDAVTAGRTARGERWALEHYQSRNEVKVGGELLLRDALELSSNGTLLPERMGRFQVFALAVAIGPAFADVARSLLDGVSHAAAERLSPVCVAASPLADGVLLRYGSERVEDFVATLRQHLSFLATKLGEDPFSRKW
jgi:urease accessory protein